MNKKISVVVSAYFEELVIETCYQRLTDALERFDYELVFVDDGSKDHTLDILRALAVKDTRVKVLSFSRNFGHQAAVTAGLRVASGDAVVIIDADLQDPPEIIPDMIALWEKGNEVVYAKRKRRKGESLFKRLSATVFYRLLRVFSDTHIPEDTGDFRLMDRKVVEAFNAMGEHNRFIRGMVAWLGFKQVPLEYVREKRHAGKTKYTLKKMMSLSYNAIFSFSVTPIKFIKTLGLITLAFAFGVIVYVLVSKSTGNAIPGWSSVMIVTTVLMGVQLFSMGILGEYIARTYEEARKRPIYLIDEKINFEENE
ncbi:MAG: glycosyltransferase family 2 protein [Eubacteriales bacterium]